MKVAISGRRTRKALWALLLLCAQAGAAAEGANVSFSGIPSVDLSLSIPAINGPGAALPQPPQIENAAQIPQLPPSLAILPQEPLSGLLPRSVGAEAGAKPEGVRLVLENLAGDKDAQPGDRAFDGRQPPANSNAPASPELPPSTGPRLPQGLDRVVAGKVETAADVRRLIPSYYGPNSRDLSRRLVQGLEKMKPYDVYTYFDKKGGRIIGIDLSRKPGLIDLLPDEESHEVRLIKKIQLWNLDLQVVVRENDVTPDLIVGGVFTELKTRMADTIRLSNLLDKANGQVAAHALRHGPRPGESLGPGAVVIDLMQRENGVPMEEVSRELDFWRRAMASMGRAVALKKIYVFGGLELREFERRPDGSYAPVANPAMPFAPSGIATRHSAEVASRPDTSIARAFARDGIERAVKHWIKKRQYGAALRAWEKFTVSNDAETVQSAACRLSSLLETAREKRDNPKPRTRRR